MHRSPRIGHSRYHPVPYFVKLDPFSFHSQVMSMCWTGQLNIISNDPIYFDPTISELTIFGNWSERSTKNTLKKQNINFAGRCLIFDLNRGTGYREMPDKSREWGIYHVTVFVHAFLALHGTPQFQKYLRKAIPIFPISNFWMSLIITLNMMFFFCWHLKSNRTYL